MEEKSSNYNILRRLHIDWVSRNIITIILLILYISYGIIITSPNYYSWFELKRDILTFEEILVGIVEIPLRVLNFGLPWWFLTIITVIYFIIAGIVVGKVIHAISKKGWIGKIIVICAIIVNCAFGLFLGVWGDLPVQAQPSNNCEKMISNSFGLRIIVFDEIGFESGSHFFYLITSDGGKNWKQLMTTRLDDPAIPHCNTIGSLGDDFIWIWSEYNVRTSRDGGNTWNEWDWECCSYGAVKDVSYIDTYNGVMSVYPWGSNISQLTTVNGGITWEPKE